MPDDDRADWRRALDGERVTLCGIDAAVMGFMGLPGSPGPANPVEDAERAEAWTPPLLPGPRPPGPCQGCGRPVALCRCA